MNKKLLTTSLFFATSIAMALDPLDPLKTLETSETSETWEPWIGSSTPTPYYVNTNLDNGTNTAGYWFVKDDYEEGGKSKVVWPVATGDEAPLSPIIEHCKGVCGTAKLNKGTLTYNPFVTVGFNVAGKNKNGELVSGNASSWGGICITYRSDNIDPWLELSMGDDADAAINNALPTKKLTQPQNQDGKIYRTCIPWSDFVHPAWYRGDPKISEAVENLVSINFKMQGAKGQYKFNICAIGPYNIIDKEGNSSAGETYLPESCPEFPPISLKIPEISVSATWVQGNNGYDATITVMDDEKELTEGTDYEIESNVNDATGIVIKTITGKGDYAGSVVKSLVPYIDENGEPQVMYDATVLTNNEDGVTELNGGWYVATGKVNMAGIKFNGEAHLILADDATLDVEASDNAIEATENLTIYGQTKQSGTLKATGVFFGIRSYKEVTISGGSVTATGENGNGIGNGINGYEGVTISGGTVTATGNYHGIYGNNGVTISGGTVTADGDILGIYSDNGVTISGGSVTATSTNGYGIYNYNGGVTISGGKVEATGNEVGIFSEEGIITLGWTNDTDFIYASSYHSTNGSVSIAEDKSFKDVDGNVYRGPLTGEQLSAIKGKNLKPCYAVTFDAQNGDDPIMLPATFDENGVAHVEKPNDPTRDGISFEGWFTATDGNTEFDFSAAITGNTTAYAKWSVPYIDENGEPQVMYDATVLTNNKNRVTELNGGWYVATGKVNMAGIKFNSEAHLILADDATLDVEASDNAIEATENLTIYGQTKQSGTLKATAKGTNGIGIYSYSGDITIIGGSVTATGVLFGINSDDGTVTISGGSVTATSTNGLGIYGYNGVTISGGTVTATGDDNGIFSNNGVTISGGSVTATGENGNDNGNGNGIGDGIYGYEGVTISGGTVTAYGHYNGIDSDNGVTISGGSVTATSEYEGIVGSNVVTISGGSVTATGNYYGIYSYGDITLDWTNSTDFIYASSYYSENSSVKIAEDKSFKDKDGNEYSGTIDDVSDIAGKTLVPSFNGKFLSDVNIAVADIPVQKYADGKPVCPSVVVTDGKDTLTAGTDYAVTCVNNTAVTSANLDKAAIAQITGKGNYAGAIQKRFFIWENIGNYAAVQVYKDKKGDSHAEIDGAYDGTDAVAFDEDITVKSVKFNREFSVNLENGGFSTIMLPFDVKASNLTGVKSVFEFAKVVDHTVRVTYVWCNATIGEQQSEKSNPNCNELSGELKAYTPYLIEMETPTLGIKDGVVLKSTTKAKPDVSNENWVFRGVLQKKDFSENDQAIQKGIIWAYAGAARKGASIGEFVQFGNNTWVNPFRAYLVDCTTYSDASECKDDETQPEPSLVSRYRFADVFAPASSAENSLSAKVPMRVAASETASLEGMEVVIMNGDKERPTVIGHMNPATGEIRMLPRTTQSYDLKGRRVNEGRKAKGAYYRK